MVVVLCNDCGSLKYYLVGNEGTLTANQIFIFYPSDHLVCVRVSTLIHSCTIINETSKSLMCEER
jgi:hypothetical protein